VVESDEGTLAVIDAGTGAVLSRIPTGGEKPSGLAMAPDGSALVVNSQSGSVALLDWRGGRTAAPVPLRGEPSEVVVSRDGRVAFVSVSQSDEVAVLELPSLRIRTRIRVGRRPRAMALTPDGRTLLVANFQGGDVSLVDTSHLRESRRVQLTGVNLRGMTVTPDGQRAFVTGQIAANTRITAEPLDIWTNTIFAVDLRSEPPRTIGAEGWIDFSAGASPDPDGIVALEKERVAVTLSGADQALLVRTPGPYLRSYDPVIERRAVVGLHPRGIALTPDRRHLWVANEVDNSLSVLDAATLRHERRIALGIPARQDPALEGRYLFGSARLARGGQFTCSSCHPGGSADGLTWEFAHVPDGFSRRNTRSLRGGILQTPPFRWSGHDETVEEFVRGEVTGLLKGPEPEPQVIQAIRRFLGTIPPPPNPFRGDDGGLSPAGERGKALFTGRAGCAACHAGEVQGGTGQKAWVGTTPDGLNLDVPHLQGVFDSAPYLHDGRAATLEEIFTLHNRAGRHGNASQLSRQELADLLRYVREL
jgi:YVTN family beta-propeller protein